MKVLSSASLLDGDTEIKVIKVHKYEIQHERLKGHPHYNEYCFIYGYYRYKIQSKRDTPTVRNFVASIQHIHDRSNSYGLLTPKSANSFLYFIDIIDKYDEYLREQNIEAQRMMCASFFSRFAFGNRVYNPDAINNRLFNDNLFSEVNLATRTHFYRFVEFHHANISEYLPEGITLYHPLSPDIGFKISHGIEPLYIEKDKLDYERKIYYGGLH